MPKCPSCGSEINYVEAITTETYRHIVRLPTDEQERDDIDYDPDSGLIWVEDTIEDMIETSFICPSCDCEIVEDEREVRRFLEGGEHG